MMEMRTESCYHKEISGAILEKKMCLEISINSTFFKMNVSVVDVLWKELK